MDLVGLSDVLKLAKENLGPYYAPDAMNYIFARGVRCPNPDCRGLVPVIHTNVLRGGRGPYIDIHADKEHKSFTVSISEVPTAFERLRCPYCGAPHYMIHRIDSGGRLGGYRGRGFRGVRGRGRWLY